MPKPRTAAPTASPEHEHIAQPLVELYTFEEVAQRFRIPESTLRYWVQARSVQHTRVGRHVRFSTEDLDAIIRSGRVAPQGAIGGAR